MLVSFYPYSMFIICRLKNHTLFSTTSHQFSTAPQWFFRRHDDQETTAPALRSWHSQRRTPRVTSNRHGTPIPPSTVAASSPPRRLARLTPSLARGDPVPRRPRSRPPNGTLPPRSGANPPPSWTPVSPRHPLARSLAGSHPRGHQAETPGRARRHGGHAPERGGAAGAPSGG